MSDDCCVDTGDCCNDTGGWCDDSAPCMEIGPCEMITAYEETTFSNNVDEDYCYKDTGYQPVYSNLSRPSDKHDFEILDKCVCAIFIFIFISIATICKSMTLLFKCQQFVVLT